MVSTVRNSLQMSTYPKSVSLQFKFLGSGPSSWGIRQAVLLLREHHPDVPSPLRSFLPDSYLSFQGRGTYFQKKNQNKTQPHCSFFTHHCFLVLQNVVLGKQLSVSAASCVSTLFCSSSVPDGWGTFTMSG